MEDKKDITYPIQQKVPMMQGINSDPAHRPHPMQKIEQKVEKIFPPFDKTTYVSQIFWLCITFGLFYLFLKKKILPRIAYILEVRQDRIDQDMRHAQHMKKEADNVIATYQLKLKESKLQANKEAQSAENKAKAESDLEQKNASKILEKRLMEAKAQINEKRLKAQQNKVKGADEIANLIVQKFSAEKDQNYAIMEAIKSLQKD